MQNTHADFVQVIHDYMSDSETGWRIGEHLEFSRDADEDVEISLDYAGGSIVSETGAVRIAVIAMARLVPGEGLSGNSWSQAGLLCLREGDAAMAKRSVLTELGNDMMAARPVDRLGTLFDLGLGGEYTDLCIRTADEALSAILRAREGSAVSANDEIFDALDGADADFLAVSRLGRIETFGRWQRPAVPLDLPAPSGYAASMAFTPPRPADDGPFDEATYGAFRVLYGIFAEPDLVRLKQTVVDALKEGARPETVTATGADERLAVGVLLRQLAQRDGSSENLTRWHEAFDV